jgi:hypothetical protein
MAPRKEKKIKDEVGIKPEDGDEDVKTKRPARAKKPTKKVMSGRSSCVSLCLAANWGD